MTTAPAFELRLLHPKHWPLWLGVGLLWVLVTLLPYRLQLGLGRLIGRLLLKLLPKRRHTAERNLELAFPEMPAADREALVIKNFESTGIAIFETGIAWWWPNWRIQKIMAFTGQEFIDAAAANKRGLLLFAVHSLSLEIGARIFGQIKPGIGVYRPHNNPVMEYLQVHGRLRSNKALITKRDIRTMIKSLKKGEALWYTSDQDFGRSSAVFVPFFGVEKAATVVGASILTKAAATDVVPFVVTRNNDDSGYKLQLKAPLDNFPTGDDIQDAIVSNKVVEESIMEAPDQYMWLHRRFKTRPNKDDPSLY